MSRAGVYTITNKVTGKVYVGSSGDIDARWKSHRASLRSNRHCNSGLQHDWCKYGEESFVFEVVEVCGVGPGLLTCETSWIEGLNAVEEGYNIQASGGNYGSMLASYKAKFAHQRRAILEDCGSKDEYLRRTAKGVRWLLSKLDTEDIERGVEAWLRGVSLAWTIADEIMAEPLPKPGDNTRAAAVQTIIDRAIDLHDRALG